LIDDDVQQHHHAPVMGSVDEVAQVLARAEARVDLQEVLDRVAVIGVEVGALLEGGVDPQTGDPRPSR
jgi:hypothetical protein